jgi:hypothetical protein
MISKILVILKLEVIVNMDENPNYYDERIMTQISAKLESDQDEPLGLTDEMRSNISGNPYSYEINN